VAVFGCGFIHDAILRSGVGRHLINIKLVNPGLDKKKFVQAVFGKSIYIEPFLSISTIIGITPIKKSIPDI
jgi:uncharacterized membrane protein